MQIEPLFKWIILQFTQLAWNILLKNINQILIHLKDFIKTPLCLMFMKFDHLERTEIVLLVFLHNKDICS